MSLAVKYRPKTFEEVIGQSVDVKILQQAVAAKTFKRCYLFAGASGCGKTSLARLFARAINDGTDEATIELDAASSAGGVDAVRAIMESAQQRSLTGEYKIFIIDEAHAITSAGWQAFLKGIEEPSEYTIFIFCTTEPNKIPQTVLNRLQRYNFTPIDTALIKARLEYICQQEGFTNYTDACDYISKLADGGMRAAITYLEQCADYSTDLTLDNVKAVLGEFSYEQYMKLTNALIDGNQAAIIELVDTMYNRGVDLKVFVDNYISFVIDLTKYILFKTLDVTGIPAYFETVEDSSINIKYTVGIDNALTWFNKLLDQLLELKLNIKYDTSYKTTIEIYLIKICRGLL